MANSTPKQKRVNTMSGFQDLPTGDAKKRKMDSDDKGLTVGEIVAWLAKKGINGEEPKSPGEEGYDADDYDLKDHLNFCMKLGFELKKPITLSMLEQNPEWSYKEGMRDSQKVSEYPWSDYYGYLQELNGSSYKEPKECETLDPHIYRASWKSSK